MKRRAAIIALAGASLAVAGFFAARALTPDAPAPDPSLADALPDITLAAPDGTPLALADFAGRPLVINFWATWCAPCRREMPLLEALHRDRSGDPLTVIGIAIDRPADIAAYLEQTPVSYPLMVGQEDAMDAAARFGPPFEALPYTVFVAPGGQALLAHLGELHEEDLGRILAITDQVAGGRMNVATARAALAAL